MITYKDVLGNANVADVDIATQHNIQDLIPKVNQVLTLAGLTRIVTSGLRTLADHKRIYSTINAKRKAQGLPELNIPMGSQHLKGNAVDIEDADDKLKTYILANPEVLVKAGLWCEHFDYTNTWVHFQRVPPKSGNRLFKP